MHSDIEEIKRQHRIEDVVSKYVQLQRQGNKLKGLCPFHQEKTPSFEVDIKWQRFKCWGCGAAGDVIEWWELKFKVTTAQAIAELRGQKSEIRSQRPEAGNQKSDRRSLNSDFLSSLSKNEQELYYERAGIAGEEQAKKEVRLKRLADNKEVFTELYNYCIDKWNAEALCYLRETRSFTDETIYQAKYFSIDNYNAVNNHMKKCFPMGQLQQSGLFNLKEDGSGNMIFYQHRLIIPYLFNSEISYLRGRYFFEGRFNPPDGNKYLGLRNDGLKLNSPKRFYGIDVIRTMLPGQRLYITEGEFDRDAVMQMGYCAVGIPGGENIPERKYFKKLLPFKIVYCGDSDIIGSKLLHGRWTDKNGNEKYREQNITAYMKHYKKEFFVKQLPTKDANEFLVLSNAAA